MKRLPWMVALITVVLLVSCRPTTLSDPTGSPSFGAGPSTGGESSPGEESSPTPLVLCAVPPPDVESVYGSIQEVDPVDCYGGTELTFDVYWTAGAPGVVDCPPIEPEWFSCASLLLIGPPVGVATIVLVATAPPGEMIFLVALHPDADVVVDPTTPSNVAITGHFDDPAALGCEYLSPGDEPNTVAVNSCRNTFVVTALRPM